MIITETTYYIVYNEGITISYNGVIEPVHELSTGLPYLETFSNEEDWLARLAELGIEPTPIPVE